MERKNENSAAARLSAPSSNAPTMAGAFAFDLYKNRDVLSTDDAALITVGFVCAFLAAVVVVRGLLDFVSRRGYAVFGWWRIVVGGVALAALLAGA